MPAASLHDATVVLDDRAILRNVSLEIGPGLTLLRGDNGAGKTTLLRALAGLTPLARGSRVVNGTSLYVGHRPMLLRGLSPRENLAFLAAFRGVRGADIVGALGSWGIAEVMDRPSDRLSAGQRRRAALARMDSEPADLILLDEPFGDLDVDGLVRLRVSINTALTRGQSILMATHMHHELDKDATRLLVIRDGQVRAP